MSNNTAHCWRSQKKEKCFNKSSYIAAAAALYTQVWRLVLLLSSFIKRSQNVHSQFSMHIYYFRQWRRDCGVLRGMRHSLDPNPPPPPPPPLTAIIVRHPATMAG